MILDNLLIMSDKQAVATGASTNIIDFGESGTPAYSNKMSRDLGAGTKIPLLIQIVEDVVGATSVTASLQTSDTEDFADYDELASAKFNGLSAGNRCRLPVVPYGVAKRYMRTYYTVEGSASAGKVTSCITAGNDETAPFI